MYLSISVYPINYSVYRKANLFCSYGGFLELDYNIEAQILVIL